MQWVSLHRLLPAFKQKFDSFVWKPRAEVLGRLGRFGPGFHRPHSNCTELLKAPWKPIGAINPLCFQFLFYCSPQASVCVCACLAQSVGSCMREFESLWQGEHQNTEANSAIFGGVTQWQEHSQKLQYAFRNKAQMHKIVEFKQIQLKLGPWGLATSISLGLVLGRGVEHYTSAFEAIELIWQWVEAWWGR